MLYNVGFIPTLTDIDCSGIDLSRSAVARQFDLNGYLFEGAKKRAITSHLAIRPALKHVRRQSPSG